MPRPFYIIDGYNLMYAAGYARERYGPGEFEKLRHRFLVMVGNALSSEERQRTTIVFDAAQAPPTAAASTSVKGMRVIFAVDADDADAAIERLIARHSAPRQIVVVSSDRRLQKAARRRRGRFLSSEEFLRQLQTPPDTAQTESGKPAVPSETDYWEEQFQHLAETPEMQQLNTEDELEFWRKRLSDFLSEDR